MVLPSFLDLILHLDVYLASLIVTYPHIIYAILFVVIFLETGLVIAPFLPGDSLLFAAGSFAAMGTLNIWILWLTLFIAAILGDTINYSIGSFIGPKAFRSNTGLLFNRNHLARTQLFYEKHGGKTIILARFIPFIRTFAPFVAGIGNMKYSTFFAYNAFGGLVWVSLFLWGGYVFGRIPIVKNNFSLVILGIVAISILPVIISWLKSKGNQLPPHLRRFN